ncbi:hypothetical protein [Streptomyces capitiformicae]|uniref:hypothetical protein n=1 Tax=Streptomyces capitiformicae TaxID=2014920 RepID=UPI001E547DBC|nr:hypothetical protein [Streptomyces capitiformicae]
MEQRIGSNNQPLAAAAVDPSHIPGLTAPVSVKKEKQEEPEDIMPTESADPAETAEPDEAAPEREEAPEAADEKAAAEDVEDSAEGDEDDADSTEAEATDGPVFEASDRRAKIIADRKGVRLKLDDQECEFRWDEIGAIETESPRFGKRFTITVHTPDRRWYPIEIEAKSKSDHKEWETGIDEVLDAYFEDGEVKEAVSAESEESAP